MHGRHEAIALARNRLDETRILGVILQDRSKFLKSSVQTSIEVDVGAFWPEDLTELIPGHDLPLLTQKQLKDSERLLLNPQRSPVAGKYSTTEIHLEKPKPDGDS